MGLSVDRLADPFGVGAGEQPLILDRVPHALHGNKSAHGVGMGLSSDIRN